MLNNRGTEIQTYTTEMILVSIVSPMDSRGVSVGVVRKISSCLRKIGCRCVLDESVKWEFMPSQLKYSNKFCGLPSGIEGTADSEDDVEEYSEGHRKSVVDMKARLG